MNAVGAWAYSNNTILVRRQPTPQTVANDKTQKIRTTLMAKEAEIEKLTAQMKKLEGQIKSSKSLIKNDISLLRSSGLLNLHQHAKELASSMQELQTYRDQASSDAMAERLIQELSMAESRPDYTSQRHLDKLRKRTENAVEWATRFPHKRKELTLQIAKLTDQCCQDREQIAKSALSARLKEIASELDQAVKDVSMLQENRAVLLAKLSNVILAEAEAAKMLNQNSNRIDSWLEAKLEEIDQKSLERCIVSKTLAEVQEAVGAYLCYSTLSIDDENGLTSLIRYGAPTEPEEEKMVRVRFLLEI